MTGQDCITDSILRGEIWRDQIISNCSDTIPKATLYRRLSPTEGDRDLCKIMVRTKTKIETEISGTGSTAKELDTTMQKREAYLVRSRALDSVFARKSPVSGVVSFELLKTVDESMTYHLVRVRSSKALENCTASVMPISGIIKRDDIDEYHTLWQSRADATTIDLNPDEPADAYLVAMLEKDSTLDHIESLKRDLAKTKSEAARDHMESRIAKYCRSWAATRPPCYIVGTDASPYHKMETVQKQSHSLSVPMSYELPAVFPHILVFTVYSSKGSAWIPFLLEGESRSSITPRLISEYQSRGGPHWWHDVTKKRTKKDDDK